MGARIKKTLEKEVQATCVEWLKWWGALAIRTNSGSMKIDKRLVKFNNEDGCGDVLCCLPNGGRFLSLELKKPGRDTTKRERKVKQAGHRERVMASGGLAIVATSLDELRAGLMAAGYDVVNKYERIKPLAQVEALAPRNAPVCVRVVNVTGMNEPEQRAAVCYVGRECGVWKGHALANPFRPIRGPRFDSPPDPDHALIVQACNDRYRDLLASLVTREQHLAELWEQCEHGAKPLGCWCVDATAGDGSPVVCHAQILAEHLRERFCAQ